MVQPGAACRHPSRPGGCLCDPCRRCACRPGMCRAAAPRSEFEVPSPGEDR